MRQHLLHTFSRYWPIAVLLFLEVCIAITNVAPHTYLMGWDNVMPEFNFRQAFITNIFGVWQEHRGLGLPDGMGHAANLIHSVFLWILSLAIPQNMLRYTFHFLMHLTGMIGVYFLLKRTFQTKIYPLIGALFYGLNPITIQMFYTPLEAFSVHFAALPWLANSLVEYLKKPSRKNLLIFVSISILSTPQFFITTLLLPTALLLTFISIFHIKNWKYGLTAAFAFLCVNAFWLAPYLYNLPHNAPIIQEAKINQMSSGEVYERNQAFGDIKNVALLRGFMLDFESVSPDGRPQYVMNAWRNWLATYFNHIIGLMVVALVIAGLWKSTWTGGIWLISFVSLANNTPGITAFMTFLRDHVPLFAEAYRFPFTKFGLLYGFVTSILVIRGLKRCIDIIKKHLPFKLKTKLVSHIGAVAIASIVVFQSLPIFQGNFFYNTLRIHLPKDYIELFTFMNKMGHDTRTAYLPQPAHWSWKQYRFGYVGSGFVWYGLHQPLLDRAFDPWSNTNENYYWELSRALYAKDTVGLNSVLRKHDIGYILLDEYLQSHSNDRSLITEDIKDWLKADPNIKSVATFGSLNLFEVQKAQAVNFIRATGTLPSIASYTWTDNDIAYRQDGDYISTSYNTNTYTFRSLFTKRSIDEREFTVHETDDALTVTPIASTTQDEAVKLAKQNSLVFSATTEALLDPKSVTSCSMLRKGAINASVMQNAMRLKTINQKACTSFGDSNLSHAQGYLVAVESRHVSGRPLTLSLINETAKHIELETLLPTATDWTTSYFILPPLASDGLGYSVYISSDSIGNKETINDIRIINFYTLPYQEMVKMNYGEQSILISSTAEVIAKHPNPARFDVSIKTNDQTNTLILSQAYNEGWKAYDVAGLNTFERAFPYVFGKTIPNHVRVNTWANGWILNNGETRSNSYDIAIIYMPQLLQYIGLLLIPVGLFVLLRSKFITPKISSAN